jgi:hypothetical protein
LALRAIFGGYYTLRMRQRSYIVAPNPRLSKAYADKVSGDASAIGSCQGICLKGKKSAKITHIASVEAAESAHE